ncbi:hypothetical protein N9C10_01575 [Flavobacteriaceae bacterium]|nr:hypothetical protein [Flavobacteriaceae bacterium]
MIKNTYQGHVGLLNIETNCVRFYDHNFPTILGAIKFLKEIKLPEEEEQYTLWTYKGKKGLKNKLDGWVLYNDRWLEEDFLKQIINTGRYG